MTAILISKVFLLAAVIKWHDAGTFLLRGCCRMAILSGSTEFQTDQYASICNHINYLYFTLFLVSAT
ncbi:hypothetical protein RchiOBHm_Chr4g0394531 [Rosa chinensis]|uniref:Secreted protein n=1 Tax=Rosa chinensis TaxID=74649 RepID=A0A2P6QRA3_ROSCH|nr:hypothetical protein RchiOBHm_Chr4g0394531 [Rosa chinensis]